MEEPELHALPHSKAEWIKTLRLGTRLIAAALRDASDLMDSETFAQFQHAMSQTSILIPPTLPAWQTFCEQGEGVAHLIVKELFGDQPVMRFSERAQERFAQYLEAAGKLLAQWVETTPQQAMEALPPLYDLLMRFAREIAEAAEKGQPVQEALAAFWEALVGSLILNYQEHHPWLSGPEHLDARELPTPAYSQDVLQYSQLLCEWVGTQAKQLGLHLRVYRVRWHEYLEGWGGTFALLVEEQQVLSRLSCGDCMEYSLFKMQPFDLFLDETMKSPQTGYDFRREYNQMEADRSQRTSRPPRYSHGPGAFTHEPPLEAIESQKERKGR